MRGGVGGVGPQVPEESEGLNRVIRLVLDDFRPKLNGHGLAGFVDQIDEFRQRIREHMADFDKFAGIEPNDPEREKKATKAEVEELF